MGLAIKTLFGHSSDPRGECFAILYIAFRARILCITDS
jgi:hypothetical protein